MGEGNFIFLNEGWHARQKMEKEQEENLYLSSYLIACNMKSRQNKEGIFVQIHES